MSYDVGHRCGLDLMLLWLCHRSTAVAPTGPLALEPPYVTTVALKTNKKKKSNNAICSNMEGNRDSRTKWSNSERERQIPYDIPYIWTLTYSTNEAFHRKETHGLGKQTCGCQGGGGESGKDWESGVNRCKLLPSEWTSNEILLCNTGNYI